MKRNASTEASDNVVDEAVSRVLTPPTHRELREWRALVRELLHDRRRVESVTDIRDLVAPARLELFRAWLASEPDVREAADAHRQAYDRLVSRGVRLGSSTAHIDATHERTAAARALLNALYAADARYSAVLERCPCCRDHV